MRLVVVGADEGADMAVPRGRETELSWQLVKAPHHQVYWSKSSMSPPRWLKGPWSEAAYYRPGA